MADSHNLHHSVAQETAERHRSQESPSVAPVRLWGFFLSGPQIRSWPLLSLSVLLLSAPPALAFPSKTIPGGRQGRKVSRRRADQPFQPPRLSSRSQTTFLSLPSSAPTCGPCPCARWTDRGETLPGRCLHSTASSSAQCVMCNTFEIRQSKQTKRLWCVKLLFNILILVGWAATAPPLSNEVGLRWLLLNY